MIRRCEEKDLPAVVEIERLSFSHPYPLFVFKRYLSAHFFVYEENHTITGYVIGIKMGVKGLIISIAVHPFFRRRGYGKKLIEHLAREMKAEFLEIQVRRGNTGAQKFYLSLKFEIKGIIPHYYQNGEDALIMVKRLG